MRKWDLPLAHLSRRLLRVIGSLQLAAIAMSAFTPTSGHTGPSHVILRAEGLTLEIS